MCLTKAGEIYICMYVCTYKNDDTMNVTANDAGEGFNTLICQLFSE